MKGPVAAGLAPKRSPRQSSTILLIITALAATLYEALLLFTPLLAPYRFPIPYAVPIFDSPFALMAIGVAYLCLERHRLRQDVQSAVLGMTLWVTGLLAIAHIFAQPDYPGTPGVNAGVAPYFFFLSYFFALAGLGLTAHYGDRQLRLSDRGRLMIMIGLLVLSVAIVLAVLEIRPLLPSMVMRPGRLTPFAIWMAGITNGFAGIWALWGGRTKVGSQEPSRLQPLLFFAVFIWLIGLIGFLIHPYRYGISWYLAGVARPVGVGLIFVGLLREQVWLYREAHGRLVDLEGLHRAGQALVRSLDPGRIVSTIASKALEISGADAAILFRLDAEADVLRAAAGAGQVSPDFVMGLEVAVGRGASGLAVAEGRPVWTPNLRDDPGVALPDHVEQRLRQQGLRSVLAVPLLMQSGGWFGALAVFYRSERAFADADIERLSAFGTQASVAIENARAFDHLGLKARHDRTLQDFCQRLLEATDEPAILRDTASVTTALLDADCVGIFRHDAKADWLRLDAGLGWQPETVGVVTLQPAESFVGQAFLHRRTVEVTDLGRERLALPPILAAHGIRSGIALPFGIREQPLGVVAACYRTPHRFSDEDSRVLTSLAYQTALALEKVHLYAELQARLAELQETQAQLIQADKLTALGTLLSGMAHELNTPLSTIALSVELMKRHALPGPVRARLDMVQYECERAAKVIRSLLVFARRKPPERRLVDVAEVIRAALALQAPEFDLHHIRVATALEPTPPTWADPDQLQQVLLNLFSNAVHAIRSAHGQGGLTVGSSSDGATVVLWVEDDGPGIPAEHLSRIFDPFFTTKAVGEGTGLGLSLALGIVESHGGRMRAENIAGGGARFTLTLPVVEGPSIAEAASLAVPSVTRLGRILVVDDHDQLRGLVTEVVTGLGHQVDEAPSGQEAVARLARDDYDVVLLDLRLPDLDGQAIWRWLLADRPALAPRVIFMTGDTMSDETQTFLMKADRPVLTKPLTVERIRRAVNEALTASAAREAAGT
jgi:signal transduction histidine kinase/ActR/RegA family two-component response regulator